MLGAGPCGHRGCAALDCAAPRIGAARRGAPCRRAAPLGGEAAAPSTSGRAASHACAAMRPYGAGGGGARSSAAAAAADAAQQQQPAAEAAAPPPDGGACPIEDERLVWTTFVAETLLPTRHGRFRLRGYRHTTDGGRTFTEPAAIVSGDVEGCEDLVLRVHDACFTSEVLGSLKCDCREQLQLALEAIRAAPPGMVVYLQQEGRGIGLANKIAAYALQERGLDTVDANRALGLPDDCREYSAVRHILEDLRVRSVRLMTNNPRKLAEVAALGVAVTGRVPCVVRAQEHSAGYLKAKARRMDHLLGSRDGGDRGGGGGEGEGEAGAGGDYDGAESEDEYVYGGELDGAFCFWDHGGEPGPSGIPLTPAAGAPAGAPPLGGAPIGGAPPPPSPAAAAAAAAAAELPVGGCGSGSSIEFDD